MSRNPSQNNVGNMHARFESLESRRLFAIGTGATTLDIGSTRFFVNSDVTHGAELWKSDLDGSNATLVKDISPGVYNSSPQWMFDFNGTLFFSANGSSTGDRELWKSDGTPGNTVLVKNIYGGSSSSNPHDFRIVNNHLLFLAATNNVPRLLVTDGTSGGTFAISPGYNTPNQLLEKDGLLYFEVEASGKAPRQIERWQTDGTTAGTVQSEAGALRYPDGSLRIFGSAGNDDIQVHSDSGTITVTIGSDSVEFDSEDVQSIVINSLLGTDTIVVGDEIDLPATIRAGATTGSIQGGSGDDHIIGSASVNGGTGDDTLSGGSFVDGGPGRDYIDSRGTIVPDANDVGAHLVNGIARLYGSHGIDTILVRSGFSDSSKIDLVLNGQGVSFPKASITSIWVEGDDGNDLITIQNLNLTAKVYGQGGNDVIFGSSGAERLSGGDGNDWINGGDGNDVIYGDAGNDRLFGGDGNDYINGGAGVDVIRSGAGRDRIIATIGLDDIRDNSGDLVTNVLT